MYAVFDSVVHLSVFVTCMSIHNIRIKQHMYDMISKIMGNVI